jgi:transposase
MLLDGAGWHHARDLVLPDNLRLLFLPPYSPELNPVEHVWEYLRENHFGNDTFTSLDAVGNRLCQGLRALTAQPDLVRSLTCFDWLNTIRLSSN